MILSSNFTPLIPVILPYQGRQKYMHSFDLSRPVMAPGYEDYLDVVSALCLAAGARTGMAHMTVDEKVVTKGSSQRRPGPHVDGCFMPEQQIWGHPGPGWLHYCNNVPYKRMPIIVAASVPGCRAWRGTFEGQPKNDGDLSHLDLGPGEVLQPNYGYLLTPDCIHESMAMTRDVQRTFLRIALPVGGNV